MVSKADYLNYMQGSGYETSPIYQQGVERWDPESLESAQLEQLYGSPLNKYIWDAAGMAGSDTGMFQNHLNDKKKGDTMINSKT